MENTKYFKGTPIRYRRKDNYADVEEISKVYGVNLEKWLRQQGGREIALEAVKFRNILTPIKKTKNKNSEVKIWLNPEMVGYYVYFAENKVNPEYSFRDNGNLFILADQMNQGLHLFYSNSGGGVEIDFKEEFKNPFLEIVEIYVDINYSMVIEAYLILNEYLISGAKNWYKYKNEVFYLLNNLARKYKRITSESPRNSNNF